MLTADKLKALTELGPKGLAVFLDQSGYSMCAFETAKFLGITNGGQLCYQVSYFDDAGTNELELGKVFISYDHVNDRVTADF